MGIMGLFPEIPAFPAFPEIPENSPKRQRLLTTQTLLAALPLLSSEGVSATAIRSTTPFIVRSHKAQQQLLAPQPLLSSEAVRCGASQKKPPKDSTNSTALGGLNFWDVPQIAAYHDKRLFGVRYRASLTYHRNLHLTWIGHLILNLLCYIV